MSQDLYDPYESKNAGGDGTHSASSVTATVNGFERPPRVEDMIPRHPGENDGRPKIWLPDGSKMLYYGRPSSRGKKIEDTRNLSAWEVRVILSAFLDYGDQSEALQIERSALGPSETSTESKRAHDKLYQRAKEMVSTASRVGTALHTITERYDLGLPVIPPAKFKADLEEWKRLTEHFEIATMPDGRPGVECFVAFDQPRFDPNGEPILNRWGYHDHVRLAGTFDRLWRYKPCDICGCQYYVGDLKSGKNESVQYNGGSWGVQEGVYAWSDQYVPAANGLSARRYPIPDVCKHLAITLSLPAGSGHGEAVWTNIVGGHKATMGLIPEVMTHRNESKKWLKPFIPSPNLWAEVDRCGTPDEIRSLFRKYPTDEWKANDNALIQHASSIIALMNSGGAL
jgi:hypothetical protein